jgi:hypothetical protein
LIEGGNSAKPVLGEKGSQESGCRKGYDLNGMELMVEEVEEGDIIG